MNPIITPGESVGSARTNLFPFDAPVCGVRRLLAVALGVSVNTLNTDQIVPINLVLAGANYIVTEFWVNNAQVNNGGTITNSMTTATLGVFTAAAGGGTAIVSNAALSGLTALTGAGGHLSMTIAGTTFLATQAANPSLYVRTGTAQGASTSATVDVYIWGIVLP
jgi:hypothetical protein